VLLGRFRQLSNFCLLCASAKQAKAILAPLSAYSKARYTGPDFALAQSKKWRSSGFATQSREAELTLLARQASTPYGPRSPSVAPRPEGPRPELRSSPRQRSCQTLTRPRGKLLRYTHKADRGQPSFAGQANGASRLDRAFGQLLRVAQKLAGGNRNGPASFRQFRVSPDRACRAYSPYGRVRASRG
jgi:hypothetical protein